MIFDSIIAPLCNDTNTPSPQQQHPHMELNSYHLMKTTCLLERLHNTHTLGSLQLFQLLYFFFNPCWSLSILIFVCSVIIVVRSPPHLQPSIHMQRVLHKLWRSQQHRSLAENLEVQFATHLQMLRHMKGMRTMARMFLVLVANRPSFQYARKFLSSVFWFEFALNITRNQQASFIFVVHIVLRVLCTQYYVCNLHVFVLES